MDTCLFGVDKLVFLGFVVSSKGVHVDESKINAITERYHYPIPRLYDMLDELSGPVTFSKIDLKRGYYQVRTQDKGD